MSNHHQPVGRIALVMHILVVAGALLFARPAAAIDGGYAPPNSSTEFDAVCAMSKQGLLAPPGSINTFCSGTLVAPNIVLTARHCLQCAMCPCESSTDPQPGNPWMVRFRRLPNGSLGNYDVEVIGRIVDYDNCASDTALLILAEPVTHIECIPVDYNFLPVAGTEAIAAGWGFDGSGSWPGGLRLADVVIDQCSGTYVRLSPPCVRMHDSGGPVLWRDPCGQLRVVATHVSDSKSYSVGLISPMVRAEIGDTPEAGCEFPSAELSYGADIRTLGTVAARAWIEVGEEPTFLDHEPVSLTEVFDPEVDDGVFYQERTVARGAGLSTPLPIEVSCGEELASVVYGSTTFSAGGEPEELAVSWGSSSQHVNVINRDPECEQAYWNQTIYGTFGPSLHQIATPFEVSGTSRPWVLTVSYGREYEWEWGSTLIVKAQVVVDADHDGIADSGETRLATAEIPTTSLVLNSFPKGNGSCIVELPPGDYVLVANVIDRVEPYVTAVMGDPSVDRSLWYRTTIGVKLEPWR